MFGVGAHGCAVRRLGDLTRTKTIGACLHPVMGVTFCMTSAGLLATTTMFPVIQGQAELLATARNELMQRMIAAKNSYYRAHGPTEQVGA